MPVVDLALSEAEVDQDRPAAALLDHDVRRLHVAMNDAGGVGRREAVGHLKQDGERAVNGHMAAVRRVLFDDLLEVAALDVLHGEVIGVAVGPERIDLHDVLVANAGERGCLAAKPRLRAGLARMDGRDELDGHLPSEAHVARQVHAAHRTGAQLALEGVAPVDHLHRNGHEGALAAAEAVGALVAGDQTTIGAALHPEAYAYHDRNGRPMRGTSSRNVRGEAGTRGACMSLHRG